MSAELSPKTSPGRHQDPTHQDALSAHEYPDPSMCHAGTQQSPVPHIWGRRPAGTTPASLPSPAQPSLLLPARCLSYAKHPGKDGCPAAARGHQGKAPSGRLWVCSRKPSGWWGGTWGQGVAKQQGSTALRAGRLRHYRQTDRQMCARLFPH